MGTLALLLVCWPVGSLMLDTAVPCLVASCAKLKIVGGATKRTRVWYSTQQAYTIEKLRGSLVNRLANGRCRVFHCGFCSSFGSSSRALAIKSSGVRVAASCDQPC